MQVCLQNGYQHPRIVAGKLCALRGFLTTIGLVVGVDEDGGYERRYCYKEYAEAWASLCMWNPLLTPHPEGPWIKAKGLYNGVSIDCTPQEIPK